MNVGRVSRRVNAKEWQFVNGTKLDGGGTSQPALGKVEEGFEGRPVPCSPPYLGICCETRQMSIAHVVGPSLARAPPASQGSQRGQPIPPPGLARPHPHHIVMQRRKNMRANLAEDKMNPLGESAASSPGCDPSFRVKSRRTTPTTGRSRPYNLGMPAAFRPG